ncbi:MAG: hypothetical protein HY754_15900 [Nitrospirae bacterium]|nr:hypothetical protein [Nitrospirota bacterium]
MHISINFRTLWDSDDKTEKDAISKTCIHSGNSGDIIYSLPAVKELGAEHFIINLCRDTYFKGRNIDLEMAKALSPLLLAQPYIKRVSIVSSNLPLEYLSEPIEGGSFILDKFRLQDVFKHHLAISHAKAFNLHINLYEKWLHVETDKPDNDYIVVALTPRYRSLSKEFWLEVLAGLKAIIVIGVPDEFHCLSGVTADFITCGDFLEMAKIIGSARLFIGNPSLAYAIAEGLKVPRMVELPSEPRNAYPIGRSGYIAPHSVKEARDLIERLVSDSPEILLQYQHKTMHGALSEKDIYIGNLENTMRDRDVRINNLETHISNLETHISNLGSWVKNVETRAENLEIALKDKDNHINNLETHINNLEPWAKNVETHAKNLEIALKDKGKYINHLEAHISNLEPWAKNVETHAKNLEIALKNKENHINNLEIHRNNLDQHIINIESHVRNCDAAIRDKDIHIQNIESMLKEKETTLNNIYGSRGWKVLHAYYVLKGKILHLPRVR